MNATIYFLGHRFSFIAVKRDTGDQEMWRCGRCGLSFDQVEHSYDIKEACK
jgi:hypothetical protein